jgi:integrase
LVGLRRGHEVKRYLEIDAVPEFGAKTKAAEIRRRDVIALLQRKAYASPVAANRLLQAVRRVFNWAIEQDLLETSPCLMVKRPSPERSRDRVLDSGEIHVVWERLPNARRMSGAVRVVLRLILITAQRPGEVVGMRWNELDLDKGWWEIPRERTKADRVHRVPLTSLAVAEVKTRPKGDPWVFPSINEQPLQVHALSHAVRHNLEHFGIPHWTPHDLRRTAASHIAGLGVDRFTLARILNHTDREVTAVYDRYTYDDEKRKALRKWDRALSDIISGKGKVDKVVAIDSA